MTDLRWFLHLVSLSNYFKNIQSKGTRLGPSLLTFHLDLPSYRMSRGSASLFFSFRRSNPTRTLYDFFSSDFD